MQWGRDMASVTIRKTQSLGNACCHSVQNVVSYSLLSKIIKIKIYRTVILLVFCMGVKLVRSY